MKVLIVEDNQDLLENMQTFLVKEGHHCLLAKGYDEAIDQLISYSVDIIILDLMLPDGNGLDVLRYVQNENLDVGVIISSAKTGLDDRLMGLDLGADDYITKPFHLAELNARIKAIYRRKHFNGAQEISFNEIVIHPDTMEVIVEEVPLVLTPKEYELLLYFLSNKNRVLTKQAIAGHLWGEQMDMMDSFDFVYQHIKNLRKKITTAGGKDYIANVYGMGYKFNTRVA